MIHPDTIARTAFYTPSGLYKRLRIPQVVAGSPAWFVLAVRFVSAGFDNIKMYLNDAIGSVTSYLSRVTVPSQVKFSPDISHLAGRYSSQRKPSHRSFTHARVYI